MKTIAGNSSKLPLLLEVVNVDNNGRASKKQITDTGNNELPSSVHKTMSNDDLLIEILLRLPVMSILMLKFVSKRWLSLITCPNFIERRSQIPKVDPPSGLLVRRRDGSCHVYDFVPLDYKVPAKIAPLNTTFTKAASVFIILQSCNGLLLCNVRPLKFFVYNPTINQFKMLPQPNIMNLNTTPRWRMAFDPTKSANYKVIHAGRNIDEHGSSIQIETYSSKTRNWSVCPDRFSLPEFEGFEHGIYWNGAIHWLNNVIVSMPIKLDIVKHPVLTDIPLPGSVDRTVLCDSVLFQSRGSLLLLCGDNNFISRQLYIYEMMNSYSEWLLKYLIDLDDIMIPDITKQWRNSYNVMCIILGEREEDLVMVLKLHEKALHYKPASKSFCQSFESGLVRPIHSFQFIASFAGV